MNGLIKSVISYFFPTYCLGCGQRLSADNQLLVCPNCFEKLPKYSGMEPFYGAVDRLIGQLPFTEYQSDLIFSNKTLVRKLIHIFKYQGNAPLGYSLAHQFVSKHKDLGHYADITMIVPIPLIAKRLKNRGYNQSYHIARAFSEVYHIPILTNILLRYEENGGSQTIRGKEQRWQAMQDAFRVSQDVSVMGKRILVVDDLLTTGATLVQAGRALIDAGAESVSFYTLAVDAKLS